MRCPSLDDITSACLAALPRGRAWQTREGLPRPGQEIGFAPSAFNNDAFSTAQSKASILWEYWRSFAVVIEYLTQRICALRQEFWCQSIVETRDAWMYEYGLPDECDPFPDLCTKVAAIGGTRCPYYADIAARSGWSIECVELENACGSHAGCARAGNSKSVPGYFGETMLAIIVHLNESPSYVAPQETPALAGRFRAGRRTHCAPDPLTPLRCVLSRVVHAHVTLIFQPA